MAGRDVNININGKDNLSPAVGAAGRSIANLKSQLASLGSKQFSLPSLPGIGSLSGSGGIAAALGAGGAAFTAFGINAAAGMETTTVAFKTMLKSGDAAKDLLGDISKFAATTPFEFPELADASKKLLAFGVASRDIVPTLRKIGDVSSGIGAPIGEIAELYGKARVQGRLFQEDINQLTGRGIPIIQELAKQFNTTESEVRGLVESGRVNFKHLETAFTAMTSTGGQFMGLMAAQADTLSGKFSNLKDTVGRLAMEIGNKLNPSLKTAVDTANYLLGGGIAGVPTVGKSGGLADHLSGSVLTAGRDIGNQRDAIAAGKRALLTEKDPARRAQIQAQIDAMQERFATSKADFAGGMEKSNDFRKRFGAGISGVLGGTSGLGGMLGGAFDSVRTGTEGVMAQAFKGANIAKLFNETRTPQEKFDAEMAQLRAQRGEIGDDLFNRKRRMLEDDLAGTFDKNGPEKRFKQDRNPLAPLTEARFLTSAPGFSADPATRAAQDNAKTTKEAKAIAAQQLVVLQAMERKLQRQTRLGVL